MYRVHALCDSAGGECFSLLPRLPLESSSPFRGMITSPVLAGGRLRHLPDIFSGTFRK